MERLTLSLHDPEALNVFKALASATRIEILRALEQGPLSIGAIAKTVGISQPLATQCVQQLSKAGLIEAEIAVAGGAVQKLCHRRYQEIAITCPEEMAGEPFLTKTVSMPIGAYTRVEARPPCGLCGVEGPIGVADDPSVFWHPQRMLAQSLHIGHGFVEYQFPREVPAGVEIREVAFWAEISSEASLPVGVNECPSDITLWINNVDIGAWTCPGFFTGTRGRHTPAWVPLHWNQFGLLKMWRINESGAMVDGVALSQVTPAALRLFESRTIAVRLGIADRARHGGGLELFGRKFGNYAHDLVLEIRYTIKKEERLNGKRDENRRRIAHSGQAVPGGAGVRTGSRRRMKRDS
ncbi:MAG: helix-turn-helix domain-containing protein [Kiritimatiellae bacterium]|nr:helix-turn-helix domain-containing protein [Kiritimatiellia bacterium]